jgi:hypothetical protein
MPPRPPRRLPRATAVGAEGRTSSPAPPPDQAPRVSPKVCFLPHSDRATTQNLHRQSLSM